ncbi:MAG: phosphotransferase family protein [Acidimicrobiales bacterium]
MTQPAGGGMSEPARRGPAGPGVDLAAGLARALDDADPGAPPASVRLCGSVSAGATRRTVLVDIQRDDVSIPAVVQLDTSFMRTVPSSDEARLITLAGAAGVPVAEPLLATDDTSYVGVPFQLSRRVEGLSVPRQILRAAGERPGFGSGLVRQCGQAFARLHAIELRMAPPSLPRLADPSPPVAYEAVLRSLSAGLPASPVVVLGLRWLGAHRPAPAPLALVHGDLRNGNLIVDETGLVAVLDWELAHVGDPMEDLAWMCLRCWRFRADEFEAGGLAPLDELVAAYEAAGGGWREDAYRWWTVARTIWWCLVLGLQAQAFCSGASSSLVLAASGRRVAELEYDALSLIGPND